MLKIVSVAVFVAMSSCIKAAGTVPAGQIVFFRSFFAIFPIVVFLAFQGKLGTAFSTKRPLNHIARGVVGVCAMGLGFFALIRLPLPEAITLNYAQPLLVVVFSSIFLGEAIRVYRWSAVAVGLVGVLVISWPELTLLGSGAALGDQEVLGVIAALVAAAISAVAMLLVRNLVQSEPTATIVLWFSVTASILALLSLPFGWQALTPVQAGLLIAAGFCGGVAQILMTAAYRHAEASVVAPFEYTSMLLGIVVGYLAFGDVPTIHMLIGGLIVVAAGIFIIWRERQLGLERARTRQATPPQG
ncbi:MULTISPECIES: DMT family transporter [Mesorhizobium]|uniref:DMT family transporter n=1 Tax=Mesorhizobium sp. TaxID=1871066 RepID=UPI000A07C50B|nr:MULTISPECIES: DMT family transporter [Mesorhizobium]RWL19027.1 MAG: DMT family transporter [Mesorhizobium sp.]RWM71995.1 MAG: DMT family transporter [Mesorhizobium sp.]TIO25101.1 MAG: DMT family transporter [Mesorhizobium sp.]TJV57880.1 MAG: DMT family transporter [Mesorhizobium sp.]